MATVTPITHSVPCAKIDYTLATDDAAAFVTAIDAVVATEFGWTLVDTFDTTAVYMKTFDAIDRYVAVAIDFAGDIKKLAISGHEGWDPLTHLPTGADYLPQQHTVNLGSGAYTWAVFVYEQPSTQLFLELCNRSQ